MDFKVFKGKIKAVGDPAKPLATKQTSISTYSYVEMSDGQRIRNLITETGLDGKLKEARATGEDVELHVIPHPEGTTGLIAVKAGDGKIFATNSIGVPASKRLLMKAGWVLGVLLIPLLGIGLVILWRTWQMSKVLARYDEVHEYVASLPNATLI